MKPIARNPFPAREHPPEKVHTANGWHRCDACYRSWKDGKPVPRCAVYTIQAGWPEK